MEPLKPITRQLRRVAVRLGGVCVLAWLALAAHGAEIHARNPYDVIANYLHQFRNNLQWPAPAWGTNTSPWRIGILGDDPFGESLLQVLKKYPVAGRGFEIIHAAKAEDLRTCDIVYLAAKDEAKVTAALTALAGRPILTVGEADNFLKLGGIIRMEIGDHVHISINLDQARAAGLKISAGMLEGAVQIIEDGKLKKKK